MKRFHYGSPGKMDEIKAIGAFNGEGSPIWKPMHLAPIYRKNPFVTREGNGRARSNAYIAGIGVNIGLDIFWRGRCLPSDNKMTAEQQNVVIDIIHTCFK